MTALITGASSGIGLELALEFARHGSDMILVARSAERLHRIAEEIIREHRVRAITIPMDLTEPLAASDLYKAVKAQGIHVDVLVNNAGFATHGRFVETDIQAEHDEMQLNVVCLTELTKLFAQDMVHHKQGKILNVASTAAFQPGPLMAVYYATKAYVLSLSEALASELKEHGITVTTLCPGPTATNFQSRAGVGGTRLFSGNLMKARTVARAGYQGLMDGRRIVIPGLGNKLFAHGTRFVPRSLSAAIARFVQEKRRR